MPSHTLSCGLAACAIPGHRITAEDASQGPERDAKLAQKQWSFDVRRAGCHVGHQKGRAEL